MARRYQPLVARAARAVAAPSLAGASAGLLVLGIGGRLAMAALPLFTGNPVRFSWGGTVEVLIVGTGYGLAGGILLALIPHRRSTATWARGTLLGLVTCALAWATSAVGRSTAAGALVPVPTVVLISLFCFLLYGLLTAALASLWATRQATLSRP